MNKFLLSLMVILPLSTFVAAQEANEEETIEEVVTTGIKSSLIDAIDIKRKNVGVVDAITAEDIGKFPDGNLAEALSRMVGVTTTRSNDEGVAITVRGLGPNFNLVTLNGRTMPTAPPQYGGGRSFNFGDISSHGVAAVEVYKSSNATLPSGGIGATVNMITIKPLDAENGSSISVKGVRHSKNEVGDYITPELDFVFSRKGSYNGGEWGFAISGAQHEMNNREEGTNEITWLPSPLENHLNPNAVVTSANTRADGAFFYPNALMYQIRDNKRFRDNLQTTFQYEIGRFTTTLDYTMSSLQFNSYGVQTGSGFAGWDATRASIDENGAVLTGAELTTYFDGSVYSNNIQYGDSSNNNKSVGLNIEFRATDDLTVTFDYHDSNALTKGTPGGSQMNTLVFGNGCWNGDGYWPNAEASGCMRERSFDFTQGVAGNLNWAMDKNLRGVDTGATEFDSSDLGPREAFMNYQHRRSDLAQVQLIGAWENSQGLVMESLKSVDFGYSSQRTDFVNQKWSQQLINGKIADGNPINMTYGFMPDDVFNKVSIDGFLGSNSPFYYFDMTKEDALYWFGRAGFADDNGTDGYSWWNDRNTPANWPSECYRNDAFDADGNPNGLGSNVGQDGVPSSNWGKVDGCYGSKDSNGIIIEEVESVFANFNFETETSSGQSIRTQFGLRYEKEDRTSTSDTTVPTNTAWSLGGFMYGNRGGVITAPAAYSAKGGSEYVLPSLNVTFEHAENKVVKFAVSKTITRPNLEQMDVSVNSGVYSQLYPMTLSTGNPNLEPYKSTNLDLAYEYYYKEGSYAAVNYFIRDISDYHGAGFEQGSFNGVTDIFAGPRHDTTGIADDALCQWTAPQGYWGCGWTNATDFAWLLNTGYSFGCNGAADCVPDSTTGNAVYISNSSDPLYVFNLAKPINSQSGKLDGWEFALQHLFDNNFGVIANVTLIGGDTKSDPAIIGDQFALPGFGDAGNFTVFYENDNLSARVAYNLTGEYYAGMDQYNPLFVKERGQLDVSASYNLSDSITLFMEGSNVTDEEVELFARYPDMTFLYQDHGPIYKAGFRITF